MVWPVWFPDACPPGDAGPAAGMFFRLVDSETVTEDDFRSHRELLDAGLLPRGRFWADEQECHAVSCSVFSEEEGAAKLREASGALRAKRVARGSVDGPGRLMPTPSRTHRSHHSWWRNVGDTAWLTFEVVT